MARKTDNTSSFLVRFTQNIYEENGESKVQWRGRISHVQGGDLKNFTEIDDALGFMQAKLSELTKSSIEEKPAEEQEGILAKSFDIWKKVARTGPKMIKDAIKDPKAQVTQIQEQIQGQLQQVTGDFQKNIEIDAWRAASKNDFKSIMEQLSDLTNQMTNLSKKVDKLAKKK